MAKHLRTVLSLFDGMSCGQIALNKVGITYDRYLASEIDLKAIAVTQANYPGTIQMGDVRDLSFNSEDQIDLLMGGSPCQSFSFAGAGKGMSTECEIEITTLQQYLTLKDQNFTFSGQSYLFWEYVRLLKALKPKYFFLENVVMPKKWEKVITDTLKIEPVFFNSCKLTGQNRKRLYWSNLPFVEPEDQALRLGDIIEEKDCNFQKTATLNKAYIRKKVETHFEDGNLKGWIDSGTHTIRFFSKKPGTLAFKKAVSQLKSFYDYSNCITTSGQNISNSGSTNVFFITKLNMLKIRPLEPIECERLQGVPEGYTDHCSRNQRIKMLGNGWTVPVICQFFNMID